MSWTPGFSCPTLRGRAKLPSSLAVPPPTGRSSNSKSKAALGGAFPLTNTVEPGRHSGSAGVGLAGIMVCVGVDIRVGVTATGVGADPKGVGVLLGPTLVAVGVVVGLGVAVCGVRYGGVCDCAMGSSSRKNIDIAMINPRTSTLSGVRSFGWCIIPSSLHLELSLGGVFP